MQLQEHKDTFDDDIQKIKNQIKLFKKEVTEYNKEYALKVDASSGTQIQDVQYINFRLSPYFQRRLTIQTAITQLQYELNTYFQERYPDYYIVQIKKVQDLKIYAKLAMKQKYEIL